MPEIANPQLRGAVDNLITQVTPENILDVRKVLLEEVAHLMAVLDRQSRESSYQPTAPPAGGMGTPGSGFHIGRCSDDPISGPAQVSFNRKIDAVVASCWQYVHDLNSAGERLAEIARGYDLSEESIQQSFASIRLT